jgi:hypothetical protein
MKVSHPGTLITEFTTYREDQVAVALYSTSFLILYAPLRSEQDEILAKVDSTKAVS